jgi:hypothetical protein
MTPPPDLDTFRRDALARGFDEVLERQWPPGEVLPTHTHPFAVEAWVVAGQRFTLAAGVSHDERYGPQGATDWVARRQATA